MLNFSGLNVFLSLEKSYLPSGRNSDLLFWNSFRLYTLLKYPGGKMKEIDKKYFSDLICKQHQENIRLINLRINEVNESSKVTIQKTVTKVISAELEKQNEAERSRINDIFIKMGIDVDKPFESQALIQFIREAKKRSDTVKDAAFKKAVMILMNVIFFIFMLGAGTYFIDKKIEIALAPREQKQSIKKNKLDNGGMI